MKGQEAKINISKHVSLNVQGSHNILVNIILKLIFKFPWQKLVKRLFKITRQRLPDQDHKLVEFTLFFP